MRILTAFMLLVVLGNYTVIASAASYAFPTPYQLEFPGRVEQDFSQSYAFIGHNNYNVTEYFSFNTTANGGLDYVAANRFYSSNDVRFAVLDWVHPYRMFLVFANLDVAYTDSFGVNFDDGYYADNVWPITGCSNCNDLHKIGTISSINPSMTGFVDLNGDFIVADGVSIIKFTRSSDYSKSTMFTVSGSGLPTGTGGSYGYHIDSIQMDSDGNYHLIVGMSTYLNSNAAYSANIKHDVYSPSGTLIYNSGNIAGSGTLTCSPYPCTSNVVGKLLLPSTPINITTDIVFAYHDFSTESATSTYLKVVNNTTTTSICNPCDVISDFGGLQIYSGYAYISSPSENKIYRFPTTVSVTSGSGYGGGGGGNAGTVDIPSVLSYTSSKIRFQENTYHNNSDLRIKYDLRFVMNQSDYDLYAKEISYKAYLKDPSNLTVDSKTIYVFCTGAYSWWDIFKAYGEYSCEGISTNLNDNSQSKAYFVEPPSDLWLNGTYTINLYESLGYSDRLLNSDGAIIMNATGYFGGNSNNPGGGGSLSNGTLPGSTPTSTSTIDNLIIFLSMPAFWGILIFVFCVVSVAWKAPGAVGIVAMILSNLEAILGLWSPYTIYVFIVTWIIAAIFFTLGRKTTTGGD